MLVQVMRNGKRCAAGHVALRDARSYAQRQLETLPPFLHALESVEDGYPVEASAALKAQTRRLRQLLGTPPQTESPQASGQL